MSERQTAGLIRRAGMEDIPALCRFHEELYDFLNHVGLPFELDKEALPNILPVMIKSRFYLMVLAEWEGTLCGFLSASIKNDKKVSFHGENAVGFVNDLYVAPEFRSRGFAGKLLSEAESWFRENEIKIVECYVMDGNDAAKRFWGNRDYRVFGEMRCKEISGVSAG